MALPLSHLRCTSGRWVHPSGCDSPLQPSYRRHRLHEQAQAATGCHVRPEAAPAAELAAVQTDSWAAQTHAAMGAGSDARAASSGWHLLAATVLARLPDLLEQLGHALSYMRERGRQCCPAAAGCTHVGSVPCAPSASQSTHRSASARDCCRWHVWPLLVLQMLRLLLLELLWSLLIGVPWNKERSMLLLRCFRLPQGIA